MKICIFVPFMTGYGGTETVIHNLLNENNNLKLICVGGCNDPEWLENIENKRIISLCYPKKMRDLISIIMLPLLILQENPDIVISTNPVMWFVAYYFRKLFRKKYKVVSWYHYSFAGKSVSNIFLHSADIYLAISSGIVSELEKRGVSKNKIKLIFNPISRNTISIPRTKDGSTCNFIYVGRVMLDGQKNLRSLINILSHVEGDWKLTIFGEGEIKEVEQYVNEKKLQDRIEFKGFVTHFWERCDNVDALLLSSKYEGFGMVLAEAISVGVPVISYNCPSGPSDIVNKKNGFLIDLDDEYSFEKVITKFVNRKVDFSNIAEIKGSISKLYSKNFLNIFLKSIM